MNEPVGPSRFDYSLHGWSVMGGVTINQRRARPWQDLLISLAGPGASFGLYFLCGWLIGNVGLVHTDRMRSNLALTHGALRLRARSAP